MFLSTKRRIPVQFHKSPQRDCRGDFRGSKPFPRHAESERKLQERAELADIFNSAPLMAGFGQRSDLLQVPDYASSQIT
jgi:hypothetical protein